MRWTCKSTRKLAEELQLRNHPVTDRTVATLLKQAGYSLQANRKTKEGSSHPDRNTQFEYINRQVITCQKRCQPVVSVDTKKKELVGEFKNAGQEWQRKGEREKVKVHDFPDKKLGKAIPYGVYDMAATRVGSVWGLITIRPSSRSKHRSLVARTGGSTLPAGDRVDDHGRRWGQQQHSQSLVEGSPAGLGKRLGSDASRLSLPTWNE